MFDNDFQDLVKKIKWDNLKPGMVLISGIKIDNSIPYEMQNFPVVTEGLLSDFNKKYQFLNNHDVIVLDTKNLTLGRQLTDKIRIYSKKIKKIND